MNESTTDGMRCQPQKRMFIMSSLEGTRVAGIFTACFRVCYNSPWACLLNSKYKMQYDR